MEWLHGKISSGQSGILAVQKRDLTFLRQNFIPAKRDHVTTTWKKLINSHWFENAHKMMKFYKYISLLFSHRLTSYVSKNTIEITTIYWNVLLWFFRTGVLINFFTQLRRDETIAWKIPAMRDPNSTREESRLVGMKLFTCNRKY